MNARMRHTIKSLKADKRKLTVMLVLLGVAVVLWFRMTMTQTPQAATASTTPITTAAEAVVAAEAAALARPVIDVELTERLDRDLFALNPALFTPINDGDSEEVEEKSGAKPSDEMSRPLAIRTEAAELKLATTMLGSRPRALINGQVLSVGDTVDGFKLLRILHRKVVVEKNGIRVLIEM